MGFGCLAVMYLQLKIPSDLDLFLGFTAVNDKALLWDKDLTNRGAAFLSKSLTCRVMRLSMHDTVPDIFSVLGTFIIILGRTYYSNTIVSEVKEFLFNKH